MPYNQTSNQKEAVMAKKEIHKLFMNMDKELHAQLKKVATEERRDLTAQIHIMLQRQLDQRNGKA